MTRYKSMKKILPLIALVVFAFALIGCQNQAVNAAGSRESAEVWVKNTLPGWELVGFSTATLDTDADGYVSTDITVRKEGTNGPLKLLSLQCPTQGVVGSMPWQKGQGAKFHSMPFNPDFE
jgi:hypothetical protein